MVSCTSESSSSEVTEEQDHFKFLVDDMKSTSSSHLGNFTFINTTGDTYIVSTDGSFTKIDAQYFKITDLHVQVDIRSLSNNQDVVKFFAIKEADLKANIGNGDVSAYVTESLSYMAQSGGSWNPFVPGSDEQVDQGMLLINNNTDFVLFVTEGGDLNKIVGYVDRKQLNAQMYIDANGLVDLYFYDVDSGTLIDSQQVGVSKDSISQLTIGEPQAIEFTTNLRIINNTNMHFVINNATTGEPLYNQNCNLCSTLIRASEGIFSIPSYLTTSVKLQSTDAVITYSFDVLPNSVNTLIYVVENTDSGITVRLLQTPTVSEAGINVIAQAKMTCETAINAYSYDQACFDYIDFMGTAYSPTIESSLNIVLNSCMAQLSEGNLNASQCMEYINQRAMGIYQGKPDYDEVFQLRDSCNYYLISGIFTNNCLRIYEVQLRLINIKE